MTRAQSKLTQYFVHINAIISLGYLLFRYFLKYQTPFGEQSFAAQKVFQYLHILTVPLLVFVFGLIWYVHIWPKLESRAKKRLKSGLVLIVTFIMMIFSGYLIQMPFSLGVSLVGITHSVVGCVWLIIFYYHIYKK